MEETIKYEHWELSVAAKTVLEVTSKKVEEAKAYKKYELPIPYDIEVTESTGSRKLSDYEKAYLRRLLRENGYQLPAESEIVNDMVQVRDRLGRFNPTTPYFTWYSEEQMNKNKTTTIITYIVFVIAAVAIIYFLTT